jgi:hypothetical protein
MASTFSRIVLYLNGVRFYPAAASITALRDGFVNFTVTVPAVREWVVLPRRSHAALFFVDPVTDTWRLMCEGEYMGRSSAKSGEGHRSMSLMFEGLHACWQHTRLFNVFPESKKEGVKAGDDAVKTVQVALANGILISQVSSTGQALLSYQQLIDAVTAQSTRVSAGLPAFIEKIIGQTPVDSYYMKARKWTHKYFIMEDPTLAQTFNTNMLNDALLRGFRIENPPETGSPVYSLVRQYLDYAFYQMCPILAPPFYKKITNAEKDQRIGEVLFTPQLYNVVPPASNVIFKDQIMQQTASVSYRSLITRWIGKVDTPVANMPPSIIANGEVTENLLAARKELDPKTALSHGFLSREELEAGVITQTGTLTLSKINPDQKLTIPARPEMMMNYAGHLARYELEKQRGAHLSQSLVCEFLPYLIVGFPCVVEDNTAPFTGIIESITHMLSAQGDATTSIEVTYTRDAYQVSGTNRTPFYPIYLNERYLPAHIDETYRKLFGTNFKKHSAMLDESVIKTQVNTWGAANVQGQMTRCDLDDLVGRVISIPTFSCDLMFATGETQGAIANGLRANGIMTHHAMQEYQYRAGMTLSEYCTFHGLDQAYGSDEIDRGEIDPPADLAAAQRSTLQEPGHRLFGAPNGLELLKEVDPEWGIYKPIAGQTGAAQGEISAERQIIARMIQKTIQEGASEG